ncbi:uncharacterized protein LOC128550958 [Mercenaria mercenaria]|uniref:uncharacterized protein LOC128550958 n=1 Tax=Mercenaria mercenaria TaxID=6596 RepID=UPI00234E796B|nr:uncharacterized protein LOC128550958 [Mercenaria mercenaria]
MATGGLHVHTSDEIFDFTCSPCAEQNKNSEAVRYCVECQDYYCQSCADMHKMFPAMRGHKLLNKADFSSSSHQQNLPQVPTERCHNHKTKLIDMYCRDHDEVCCTSCVAENHRSCDSVTSITDVIKNRGARKEKDELIQELNTLINVCLEIKTTKEKDLSEIALAKETALDEMKKQRKELDTLDELENASKQKIENEHKKLSDESAEEKQKITEYESRLQKSVSALQASGSNEAQRFVSEKLGRKDLVDISKDAYTFTRETKTSFAFHGDPKLVQVFSGMESLGEVKRQVKSCTIPVQSLYQIKRTREQNVNIPSDKGACDILSCCFDDKGNLLLTDYDNNSLKRVSLQTASVTDHCRMPSSPRAVCCVNKEEAAVSLINRSIQFVSLRDQMKITRQITLDHPCWGISCNEGSMYITDRYKTLYIYSLSGKLISVVNHDNKGNDIFYNNRHVTFDSGKVYVCDVINGLVSFNKEGTYISSFTDSILSLPQGACSDRGGNIFVCGWGSRNVIQIGTDGKLFGEVVRKSHGLGYISSVCFDERQKRLVVTVDKSNMVHIFDLGSCDSVTSITDVIKESAASKKTDALIQELNSLINVCLKIKTTKETDLSEIDLAKERALDEITKQRKELDTILGELENASKKKIENEHQKLSDELAEKKQKITEYESRLQKRVSALQASGSNEAQRFVSEKLGYKDLKLHHHCTDTYQIKRTREQKVNIPSDKGACDIWSCCFDNNGNLLLTDYNNKSLKRVKLQTASIIDHCRMPGSPRAVCCVNKKEAAVSLLNKSIQFISLCDQMKITRQVTLDHQCTGISCNEGSMYITDEGKTVYIYNVSGKLISVVKHDSKGNDIFYNNRHVTFDRYSGKVYVCDVRNGLVSFNKEGTYISSFTDRKLRSPQGACSDGGGNVFVCGWISRNVIQIGKDGKLLGEVVRKSHGLDSIWSVCFDERQKRLVVTINNSDKIHIFDLA